MNRTRLEPGRTSRLLRNRNLSASAKLAWVWIVHAYEPTLGVEFRVNVADVASALGCSPRTVRRALAALHDAGQIVKRPGTIGGPRVYPENLGSVTICPEPRRRIRGNSDGNQRSRTDDHAGADRAATA